MRVFAHYGCPARQAQTWVQGQTDTGSARAPRGSLIEGRYHQKTLLEIGRRLLAQILGYKVRSYKGRNRLHAASRHAIKAIRRGFDRSQRQRRAVGADA